MRPESGQRTVKPKSLDDFLSGRYFKQFKKEMDTLGAELASRRKDKPVLIRLNHGDVEKLKALAARYGIGYQTLISGILHEIVRPDEKSSEGKGKK